ncbi:hypothetical protein EXU85_02505 [Spirosoma sp. KCTC 42546]|uniref:hypothetical protein n=1 Tax=Spirosoma sp. KCTC 42546 TaxID=2520506 RepID=UPI0011591CC8|nr:hypothetical protein [Spirosoma sp. KCTC 42546]QDK77527.1 hypothetical protein EXU85_02505 [Spirosoma sp. KCTC 42546]
MQKIQNALPTVTPYIETNNPHFLGRIVSIWIKEIETTIELRLPDIEVEEWSLNEPVYISLIVKHLKQVYQELEKAP